MRHMKSTATALTLAAVLFGGTALAPVPAAAQGYDTRAERSGDPYGSGYQAGRRDQQPSRNQGADMADAREQRVAMEILDNARMHINRGNLRDAWVALGMAETRLLTRSLPQGSSGEAAAGDAIGAIRDARQALQMRETDRARMRTARAMDLVASGEIVGRNVSGWRLNPAGQVGEGQPLRDGNRNTGGN